MKTITTCLLILSALIVSLVYAHSGATGIVKQRMDAMQDMADQSKIVADMFKGNSEFDRSALIDAAEAFVLHGIQMNELFPNTEFSRTGSNTDALPRIWDEWEDFSEQVTQFVLRSESLKVTALATEDIGELKNAFFKTTKSCSGCHKRFRKPKQ